MSCTGVADGKERETMLFIVVAFITFALIMLGTYTRRKFDFRIGRGIGDKNREEWGLDEPREEYHE